MGAGLVHTEMVSALGLSYKNKRTRDLLGDENEQGPVVLQLFASNATELAKGAETAMKARRFDALEINMACPMPKVTKKGAGARLLENPDEAARMVLSLKQFGLPVWVKLRKTDAEGTKAFCAALAVSGADLLLLHGRTLAQRYDGAADRGIVGEIAKIFPGMVAASGDYYEPDDAARYLDDGCVAVLAARGVLRDAFLIPRTLLRLGYPLDEKMEKFANPSARDQTEAILSIGKMGVTVEGERFTLVLARRMIAGMFKGFSGASALRRACSECRDWASMEEILTGFAL
jgi:tRNA-dihydrouridine synthase B